MFLRTYRTYVRCFFLRYFLCKSVCPSEGGTAHVRKTLVRFWTPLSCCLVILLFVFVLIFFPARVTDLAWPEVVSCLSFSRTFFFFFKGCRWCSSSSYQRYAFRFLFCSCFVCFLSQCNGVFLSKFWCERVLVYGKVQAVDFPRARVNVM